MKLTTTQKWIGGGILLAAVIIGGILISRSKKAPFPEGEKDFTPSTPKKTTKAGKVIKTAQDVLDTAKELENVVKKK